MSFKICFIRPSALATDDFHFNSGKEGIPGAEETLINTVKALSNLGVYCDVFTKTKTVENLGLISWSPIDNLQKNGYYDSIIFWTDVMEEIEGLSPYLPQCKVRLIRLVNQTSEENIIRLMSYADLALSQSKWYTKKYSTLSESNTIHLKNGINPNDFVNKCSEKIKGRIFYGSDYDRGLIYLLQLWPKILEIKPEASLHICYGWQVFEKKLGQIKGENKEHGLNFKANIEQLMNQKGIKHLGRISHEDVNNELCSAEYWIYPCTFPENCSTLSLKAQAAKCVPIIIPSGGLYETVPNGINTKLRLWERSDPCFEIINECIQEWARNCIKVLSGKYSDHKIMLDKAQRKVIYENNYQNIALTLLDLIYKY